MPEDLVTIPDSLIEDSILMVRGHKVILDRELARLYAVSTKALNQAVSRLRSQIVTLKENPRNTHQISALRLYGTRHPDALKRAKERARSAG